MLAVSSGNTVWRNMLYANTICELHMMMYGGRMCCCSRAEPRQWPDTMVPYGIGVDGDCDSVDMLAGHEIIAQRSAAEVGN